MSAEDELWEEVVPDYNDPYEGEWIGVGADGQRTLYRAIDGVVKRRRRPITPLSADSKPSEVTDADWLSVVRKKGIYPAATASSGKWLIFVPVAQIDDVWAKIKLATEEGRLGSSAKVSTAKPNPNATSHDRKVLCVYTYDWTDEEDVRRIRQELRTLGITWKIPYKADEDTGAGKYKNRGHKRISKYYE